MKLPGSHTTHPMERDDVLLTPEMRSLYKTIVGKCLFVALETPDIQFAVRDLSRAATGRTVGDFAQWKKLARYIAG
jgi:hypothetical protein